MARRVDSPNCEYTLAKLTITVNPTFYFAVGAEVCFETDGLIKLVSDFSPAFNSTPFTGIEKQNEEPLPSPSLSAQIFPL
jgi:hypothetical protein